MTKRRAALRAARLVGAVAALLVAASCAQVDTKTEQAKRRLIYYYLSPAVEDAAEALAGQLGDKIDKKKPLIVSTIVDINDLNRSSPFGRTVAELLTARLSAAGYLVQDVKLRKQFAIREKSGEFALSRRLGDLNAESVDAQAFVTGSYAEGGNAVFVSLRIVRATDGHVFAGAEFELLADRTIKSLLDPRYYWVYRLEEGLKALSDEERRMREGRMPGLEINAPGSGTRPDVEVRPLPTYVPARAGDDGQVTFLRGRPAR